MFAMWLSDLSLSSFPDDPRYFLGPARYLDSAVWKIFVVQRALRHARSYYGNDFRRFNFVGEYVRGKPSITTRNDESV